MNYIVFYSKDCSPTIKEFKSKAAAVRFANKHEQLNNAEYSDNWVDCIVEGSLIKTYRNWYSSVKENKK